MDSLITVILIQLCKCVVRVRFLVSLSFSSLSTMSWAWVVWTESVSSCTRRSQPAKALLINVVIRIIIVVVVVILLLLLLVCPHPRTYPIYIEQRQLAGLETTITHILAISVRTARDINLIRLDIGRRTSSSGKGFNFQIDQDKRQYHPLH